ncbi:MAG: recombination protein O N-terminal domain-containing protein [Treponema sp.]|nr:recombination protein O N-terminal domain-containing protein [Treponema sp.]
MQRSYYTKAIVLNLKQTGENNNSVTLLTPDKGIIYATLYGGPKSKLRSLVAQWHSGTVWLYDNPEKKQTKICDFEVANYHTTFGQNLFKMYAASLAAELAIKTRCAGSSEQCHTLLQGFFDGMELCDEEQSRLGLIRFLWRYLELMGVQPDATPSTAFAPDAISYYNRIENCFMTTDVSETPAPYYFPVRLEAVRYLAAVSVLEPSEVRRIKIDRLVYEELKGFVFFLLESNLETELNSIKTGTGIL